MLILALVNTGILLGCSISHADVSTFAGSTVKGDTNGTITTARFDCLYDITRDRHGNFYVSEAGNRRIRKIATTGEVTTLAGSTAGHVNGTGTAAKFLSPSHIAIDSAGTMYVNDSNNYRIRKITANGAVTDFAGSTVGYANGAGAAAKFNYPSGIAVDSTGNIYVSDSGNHRIRKITSAGVVATLAGSGVAGYTDNTGRAAKFNYPRGITVDSTGNIYVADNNRIRKITPQGVVTTLAGSGVAGHVDGPNTTASFKYINGIVAANNGNSVNVYVTEYGSNCIRKITQ
jgi:sugar lactone lactonase YvrE